MQKELVVFCAVLGITIAAVAIGQADPKPEKFKDVEGCYINELDAVIPFGESRPARTSCMEYRCEGQEWVSYVSCVSMSTSPPYRLVEEKNKPYPQCCPKLPNAEQMREMERENKV